VKVIQELAGLHLLIENLALHQQLATLAGWRHPDVRPADRVFWVLLRRPWSRWVQALAIVEPDTVVRWHRAGFRIYWNWLSRRGKRSGRPPLPREVRALIRRMATENPWGAPSIHGELLCLGFDVSERSVSRYLCSLSPTAGATWSAAPSPAVRPLPGSRSSYARPFPSSRRRAF
jgi:putative transposase